MKLLSAAPKLTLAAVVTLGFLAVPADKVAAQAQSSPQEMPREPMERRQMQEHMQKELQSDDAPLRYKTERGQQSEVKSEQRFLVETAMASRGEVELGSLAQQQSENSQVKEFGQMLERDHGAVVEQVAQLLEQHEIAMPQQVPPKMTQTFSKLSQASGEQFDRQFLNAMIKEHKRDIQKFEKWQQKAENQEVKSFIDKTLPTLKDHLKAAEELQQEVGGGKAS